GQIPAATTGLTTALGLVAGPVADHYGHRRVLLIGLLTLVIGSLGCAVSFSFGVLAAMSLIAAISQAAIPPVAMAVVSTRFPIDERRRAIGWVVAASSGAVIIGTQIMTTTAYFAGWRMAFVALALVSLAIAAIQFRALPADEVVHAG